MLIINVTVTFGQQLPLDHIKHELYISLPSNLLTSHTANKACNQKVINSVILSHHLTNITLSRNTIPQIILNISSGIRYPFMPYDIAYDYILNIIVQADTMTMDRFFFLNTYEISSSLNHFHNVFSLNRIYHGP